jgi:nicotinamide-nucleotide amidase
MRVEIINTGTELMLGSVLNSHQQWLCRELSNRGFPVARQTSVPDASREIECAVREALSRADVVITTGGLGPTSDDVTREVIARMLGRSLSENAEVLDHIRTFFLARKRPMPERTAVQAAVIEGAVILENREGTAPGMAIHVEPNPFRTDGKESWLILLPGPGRELRPMFLGPVIQLLDRVIPVRESFACRVLRTVGIGESILQERIERALHEQTAGGLELGYCARPLQVDVRLSARGGGAAEQIERAEHIVRAELGDDIFGAGEETLEQIVVGLLTRRKETLALAESCTGGCVANRLTNVPGASAVFRAGWVTYSNEAKQQLPGVRPETLQRFGAVSEAVAREMAAGARHVCQTDYAIAITGIAGPSGGSAAKPVGTVFTALASAEGIHVRHDCHVWDRLTFKEVTANQALNWLRLLLQKPRIAKTPPVASDLS